MQIDVSMERFGGQFTKAQYMLDSIVMTDMIPFMPMRDGNFINVTKGMSTAIAGSGKVYAAAPPFGRFLYEGKTMVDEGTGSTWARPAAKKVLVSNYKGKTNAKIDLNYTKNKHPQAQAHWFEAAKKVHGKNWIEMVKKVGGGGANG